MKNIILYKIIFLLFLFSCNNTSNNLEKEATQYLNMIEKEYEILNKQAGKEVWEYYSDTTQKTMGGYKNRFASFLLDNSLITEVSRLFEKRNRIANDTLTRRLALWKNILACARVDFDPEIMELQNVLEKQLTEYPSIGISDAELEKSILKLIHLRNDKAKQQGYSNYAYMVLQNTGIDTIWFDELIHTIDSGSIDAYNLFVRDNLEGSDSFVDYDGLRKYIIGAYMMNDTPEVENNRKAELITKTLSDIGIEINNLPIQFKIRELPPGIGGFGNCIDIPNDFRAVAMPDLSFYYLLHEIGHGLHWTGVRTDSPVLKGYEWCKGNLTYLYGESMAEIVARFSQNDVWLKAIGFDGNYIDSIRDNRENIYPVCQRLKLINSLFEIELYRQPEKEPALIKKELYEKYFHVQKDFSRHPNLIHLPYISYPVYEQNYLIADIIAWQMHEHLEKQFGEDYALNSDVGEFLKENLWKEGELKSWQERIFDATGKELDIEEYLKSFN